MKIKISEATPLQPDWMVAKAWGLTLTGNFHPATNWAQGGPIIERERIDCISDPNGTAGWLGRNWIDGKLVMLFGPTPLIAAMRCYVASKMGDEVEIPEELS